MIVTLDEPTHLYRFDGEPVVGVTECLNGLGLDPGRPFYKPEHRERGHRVHAALQSWLEGKPTRVLKQDLGFVEAGMRLVDTLKLEVLAIEQIVYSVRLRVAGRIDFLCRYQSEPTIIDWGSGTLPPTKAPQTAGYEILAVECQPIPGLHVDHFRRMGVELHADGSIGRPKDFSSHLDGRRFLAAVDLYRHFVWTTPQAAA